MTRFGNLAMVGDKLGGRLLVGMEQSAGRLRATSAQAAPAGAGIVGSGDGLVVLARQRTTPTIGTRALSMDPIHAPTRLPERFGMAKTADGRMFAVDIGTVGNGPNHARFVELPESFALVRESGEKGRYWAAPLRDGLRSLDELRPPGRN